LHRAEGFGRGVAEAMLLDKDVVVSNYSGTQDFAFGPRVHPVSGRLIPIKVGDYPGATGKERWFDADVNLAARTMERLASRAAVGLSITPNESGHKRLAVEFVAAEVKTAIHDARARCGLVKLE
jgi:hypothetical protein